MFFVSQLCQGVKRMSFLVLVLREKETVTRVFSVLQTPAPQAPSGRHRQAGYVSVATSAWLRQRGYVSVATSAWRCQARSDT